MIIEPDFERKFTRIDSDKKVNLEFVDHCYDRCRVKDLSLAGMYIAGTFLKQVHEGQACNIDLVSEGLTPDYHLHALARVVRKDEQGVALQFTSMPYESYMILQAALLNETSLASNKKILGETCPFEVADDLSLPQ